MSAYTISTTDIKQAVLKKCGEVTDGTSPYEVDGRVLDYIQKANLKVLAGGNEIFPELSKPWPWAIASSPLVLTLQPPFQSGTVAATANSTTITFSQTPTDYFGNNVSLAGWWVKLSDRPDWFKIVTHTSGTTTATIDNAYSDTTIAASAFLCVQLEYTLTSTNGILRLVSPFVVYRAQDQRGDQESKIYMDDESSLLRDYPMPRIEQGTPTRFCVTNKTSSGAFTVRFNKYVEYPTRVEVRRVDIPDLLVDSSSNFPLVPVDSRDILVYTAAYLLCVDKNDDRQKTYLELAKLQFVALQKAAEKEKTLSGKNRGKITPRQDNVWRGKRYITQEAN